MSGGRGTAGNAYTGNEVHAGHIEGTNASGPSGSAAWARGEDGGAARIGDDVYAGRAREAALARIWAMKLRPARRMCTVV